jgi:hypothetical protein
MKLINLLQESTSPFSTKSSTAEWDLVSEPSVALSVVSVEGFGLVNQHPAPADAKYSPPPNGIVHPDNSLRH